ncbi:MAG: DUF4351 domain-containing protein [Planctomycetes bacterium]|nr:DUF4351 domain-containing protein [Planctomycetota bacterium]
MSKPYDAVGKDLLELDPAAWVAFLGVVCPANAVSLIDSELSTVTTAADKVVWIADDPPWILDVEFQSWSDTAAPPQLLKYNALLQEKHKCPVASVLVVMRESANSTAYNGRFPVTPPFGPAWEFGYTVVRLWEASAEALLTGPLALTPLAPVANLGTADVAEVLRRSVERENREADPARTDRMFAAISVLLTMRYGDVISKDLLKRYPDIREIAPFKMFLEDGRAEGRVQEARAVVLRQGRKKFGAPSPEHEANINSIADLTLLETLSERLLDVKTWDELLKSE